MRKIIGWSGGGLALLLPLVAAGQATLPTTPKPVPQATSCNQSVATVATRLGISLDSGGTGRLARSDGVVQAPQTGSADVVHPPPTGDTMPTAPPVTPQSGSSSDAVPAERSAARQLQIRSLLTAAQAAATRGDETSCRTSLNQAVDLAQRSP